MPYLSFSNSCAFPSSTFVRAVALESLFSFLSYFTASPSSGASPSWCRFSLLLPTANLCAQTLVHSWRTFIVDSRPHLAAPLPRLRKEQGPASHWRRLLLACSCTWTQTLSPQAVIWPLHSGFFSSWLQSLQVTVALYLWLGAPFDRSHAWLSRYRVTEAESHSIPHKLV